VNKTKINPLLTLLLVAMPVLTGCAGTSSNRASGMPEAEEGMLPIGTFAPEIIGKDVNGKTLKLSDYRGKVVMLDFFGNW